LSRCGSNQKITLDEGMAGDPFLRTKIGLFSALVAPLLTSV
jgi:hypothetical protein